MPKHAVIKLAWLLLLYVSAIVANAQGNAVFVVKANNNINVLPRVDTLMAGKSYTFKLTGINVKDIAQLQFTGGKAYLIGDSLVIHTMQAPVNGKTYYLQIFSAVNKQLQEVYRHAYCLLVAPQVQTLKPAGNGNGVMLFSLNNVKLKPNTNVLAEQLTGRSNMLFAYNTGNLNINYSITGYTVKIECNGQANSYNGTDAHLTTTLITALKAVQQGCKVTVTQVHYMAANQTADNQVAGPFILTIR